MNMEESFFIKETVNIGYCNYPLHFHTLILITTSCGGGLNERMKYEKYIYSLKEIWIYIKKVCTISVSLPEKQYEKEYNKNA